MTPSLPDDLATFYDSYITLFGTMPPLPAAKFESTAAINPEALRLAEQQRAHAFYSDVIDIKTTQLILFGILLYAGAPPAKFHALAARQAGVTWEELQKVIEVAAAVSASSPMNLGGSILMDLQADAERKN